LSYYLSVPQVLEWLLSLLQLHHPEQEALDRLKSALTLDDRLDEGASLVQTIGGTAGSVLVSNFNKILLRKRFKTSIAICVMLGLAKQTSAAGLSAETRSLIER
jgi:hypothetical protein